MKNIENVNFNATLLPQSTYYTVSINKTNIQTKEVRKMITAATIATGATAIATAVAIFGPIIRIFFR